MSPQPPEPCCCSATSTQSPDVAQDSEPPIHITGFDPCTTAKTVIEKYQCDPIPGIPVALEHGARVITLFYLICPHHIPGVMLLGSETGWTHAGTINEFVPAADLAARPLVAIAARAARKAQLPGPLRVVGCRLAPAFPALVDARRAARVYLFVALDRGEYAPGVHRWWSPVLVHGGLPPKLCPMVSKEMVMVGFARVWRHAPGGAVLPVLRPPTAWVSGSVFLCGPCVDCNRTLLAMFRNLHRPEKRLAEVLGGGSG